MAPQNFMRLSDFIIEQMEPILQAWEDFAKTIEPPAFTMDNTALRDHASHMLHAIALDLRSPQTTPEEIEKSLGLAARGTRDTAAEAHAVGRLASGYTISQLVSEYRALRSSVLRLWSKSVRTGLHTDPDDVTRFNEGIDQALAESVDRFAAITAQRAEDERRRLDAVLEAAPVGISMTDATGKIVLINAENERIWGKHPVADNVRAPELWKGWWADGSPKHGQPISAEEWALARALAGEDAPRDLVEIEPFDSPGLRRTVMLHAAPIRNAIQQIVGSVVAQMDITGKVKAEAALRESEAKFRTIANAMPQMVWSTLPDGYHDYYNQQWYDFTGVPMGSTDGPVWNGMFHPADQPRAWHMWNHCLTSGDVYEIQYRLRHHSGEYRWVLGRALPIRNEAGQITRWMGTCTDIHEQKLAEAALTDAGQRKDEFLAMLAHELRNPLAAISTASQLLTLPGLVEKRISQSSGVIARQVQHMTDLVNDLLDVSRVTRGLAELVKEDLDLKVVISIALEQARPLIEARNHSVTLHLASDPAFVRGDKTRLVQVVSNLLNNAAKYTPQGGAITLRLDVEAPLVKIHVADNGSGIASSLLPHVFDLFTQGERTPDRAQGGLGLGLALVKSIMKLHDGQVSVLSAGLGHGSVFTLSLPVVKIDVEYPLAGDMLTHALPTATPMRILIVDDNLDAAHSLASLLEAQGHHTTVRGDGTSALSGMEGNPVEVFILDIGLPDMDGYELARRLRSRAQNEGATLIALTGYGQAHDRVLSKAAGFDYHFVKPIDIANLYAVLAEKNG